MGMARREAMKVAQGDVFGVPLGPDKVALGQVVARPSSGQIWIAIFWPPSQTLEVNDRLEDLIATPPVLLGQTYDLFLMSGRWPRIKNSGVAAAIPWPVFKIASAPGVYEVVDHEGIVRRRASNDEAEKLPFESVLSPAGVEMAVAALAGAAEWREMFNQLRPGPNTEAGLLGVD